MFSNLGRVCAGRAAPRSISFHFELNTQSTIALLRLVASPFSISAASTDSAASGAIRGEGRAADVVLFEESLIGFFTDAADLLGVPKSVAVIYGLVFASPAPLSFAEIEHRLHLSKGSISQGLRVLREMGAIKEVSTPKDRVELFSPDMEMRRLIQRFLEQRLEKQLDAGKTRLAALSQGLPQLAKADLATLRGRLKQLQQWHIKTRALLPVARTFLKLSRV